MPRLTLEELIDSLSSETHTPHETLAAAVHLVVAGRVYLVEGEEDAEDDSGSAAPSGDGPAAARPRSPLLRRMLALGGLLAAGALGAGSAALEGASPGAAEPQQVERSCAENALGQRFCAPDASGSAVRDALGRVHCAPGACVELGGEWSCSEQPGGAARITREGTPQCDGGCAAPDQTLCEEF